MKVAKVFSFVFLLSLTLCLQTATGHEDYSSTTTEGPHGMPSAAMAFIVIMIVSIIICILLIATMFLWGPMLTMQCCP